MPTAATSRILWPGVSARRLAHVPPADAEPSDAVDIEPLMVASRTINAAIVKSLATVDGHLTVPQLRVLVILTRTERASLSEVARDLGVNPSNASRTCEQLVRRGLLDRAEDPADRRRLALALAPAGLELVREVMRRRRELLQLVVDAMPRADQQALMSALEAFNRASEEVDGFSSLKPGTTSRPDLWLG